MWIVIIAVAAMALFGAYRTMSSPLPVRTKNTPTHVVYRISGTAIKVSLTYTNSDGGIEQKDVSIPWTLRVPAHSGQHVYVSAQNKHKTGSVKCEIIVENEVMRQAESSGAYKIASCSGLVP